MLHRLLHIPPPSLLQVAGCHHQHPSQGSCSVWYSGRYLLVLKRFEWLLVTSSEARFFLTKGDFSVTNEGKETLCFVALEEVKYSKMRAVGLYLLRANLESAAEMSLFSSSRSNTLSASVMGFHLSLACACSKSVTCAVMHLLTRCYSLLLWSWACEILRKVLIGGVKELHHS